MNRNIISLVNKKVFRNKSNILFCIIFIICFIVLFSVLNFKTIYNKHLEISFNNNVSAKTIWFQTKEFERNDLEYEELINFITSYKYDYETIKNIPHVVDVFIQEERAVGGHIEGEDFKGESLIELLRANKNTLPEIVKGSKIDENDTGVIVCPTVFYPSSSVYKFKEMLKLKKADFISGYDLLNKKITMSYEKFSRDPITNKVIEEKLYRDFLVVGLYDNRDAKNNTYDCYASIKDVNEMSKEQQWFNLNQGQPQPDHPLLIVDDGKNVSSVIKELESLGYSCDIGLYVSNSVIESIKLICNFIIIITILVILVVTIGYIKKKSINNTH